MILARSKRCITWQIRCTASFEIDDSNHREGEAPAEPLSRCVFLIVATVLERAASSQWVEGNPRAGLLEELFQSHQIFCWIENRSYRDLKPGNSPADDFSRS